MRSPSRWSATALAWRLERGYFQIVTRALMVNVTWTDGTPSLEAIAERFGVPIGALDPEFGVIRVTPPDIYAVRVAPEWAERLTGQKGTEGPFPEVRIAPFDLEEPEDA